MMPKLLLISYNIIKYYIKINNHLYNINEQKPSCNT